MNHIRHAIQLTENAKYFEAQCLIFPDFCGAPMLIDFVFTLAAISSLSDAAVMHLCHSMHASLYFTIKTKGRSDLLSLSLVARTKHANKSMDSDMQLQ